MGVQAKIINMLLYDGTLSGVIRIDDSNWNAGELFSAPRESISDLFETGACNKYGVYLLLSTDRVYVGQSSDLAKRITQHTSSKDWWESVVILTTRDDSLNHSDIDYLENVLIEKAFASKKVDCDNKKSGNPPKVDIFKKTLLNQYLEEALFLMQLIGLKVFVSEKRKSKGRKTGKQAAKPAINIIGRALETTSVTEPIIKEAANNIPPLPDRNLKVGVFVRTAMSNLADAGYMFSDEAMQQLCSEASMNKIIGMQRNLPFFKIYDPNISDGHLINGRPRFYAKPLTFGKYVVYLNSQIYDNDRNAFIKWYEGLR